MQNNQNYPDSFHRSPLVKTNEPWLKYPDSTDHRPDCSNEGNSSAVGASGNSRANLNVNFGSKNRSVKWPNFKQLEMQKNENNPNMFRRKPQVKTNKPWLKYPESPNHRPDYSIKGANGAVGTPDSSYNYLNMNIKNRNCIEKWLNIKRPESTVSTVKSNMFLDLKVDSMPYHGRVQHEQNITQHQLNHQNRSKIRNEKTFHIKPQIKKKLHSKIIKTTGDIDTDFKKLVINQFTLSDHTNKSIAEPANQTVDINFPSIDLDTECDYNSLEIIGDLKKLQDMTAADLDRDRYAHFGVHESEMKDYVRTVTFKNCLKYCTEEYVKNKVVLVVRSGFGLLPLLCVRDGLAQKVIALEQSNCIEYARRIVKDNLYSHMITFIQSSVHDLKLLPYGLQQVDVIMSDFMGECVISQGDQMEQVIEARDRFLKPNGLMIPMCVTLYSQLLEHRRAYKNKRIRKYKSKKHTINRNFTPEKKVDQSDIEANDTDSSSDSTLCSWWSDVYGFDMRSKPEIIVEYNSNNEDFDKVEWCIMDDPLVAFFDPCKVVSTACLMKKFDMYKCSVEEVRLVQCKDLKYKCVTPYSCANGGDYAHMLELFMVVDFPNGQKLCDRNVDQSIGFSTSCYSPHTRYRQTGLLLRDQLMVFQGDEFILNEFHMWRGPQINNPFENTTFNKICYNSLREEENLKFRLRYTFINKLMKAIDRRCAYTLRKDLF